MDVLFLVDDIPCESECVCSEHRAYVAVQNIKGSSCYYFNPRTALFGALYLVEIAQFDGINLIKMQNTIKSCNLFSQFNVREPNKLYFMYVPCAK